LPGKERWSPESKGAEIEIVLRRAAFVLMVGLSLAAQGCTGDRSPPARPSASTAPTSAPEGLVVVPDVVGDDLRKAVRRLEQAGLDVDLSPLSEEERTYAAGFRTHPRVAVDEVDPPVGTDVEEGSSVVILEASCPETRPC
jgi:hypothetical protein